VEKEPRLKNDVDILVTGPVPPEVLDGVGAAFSLRRLDSGAGRAHVLREHGPRIRGIASGASHGPIDGALFDQLPALEIVAHYGVGYETVDAREAARRGIVVTHTPDVLDDEVADLALGLLIATVRRLPLADRHVRSGAWSERKFPLGATLRERRIGIVGLGRIGKQIARRCSGFGLEVAYHGRRQQAGVDHAFYPSVLDLARAVDVLMLAAPGGAETQHMVNAQVLKALGPDGVLINVARGSLVDEAALIDALREGTILAAGLDVFENEPAPRAELVALENTVLLPHIGSASVRTRNAMSELVVANLVSWFAGRGPRTPVPESRSTA